METAAGGRSNSAGSLRHPQVGADQRERRASAVCVCSVEGGQGTTPSCAGAGQRRQDNDGSRHRDRRVRHEVLLASAQAIPSESWPEAAL
jgi:hypothetical protein